jgi:Copper binding proteins, plastocyanin/azurin family
MRKRAVVAVTALLVAGCGAEEEPARAPARDPKPAGPVLTLTAPPSGSGRFHFDRRRLEAPAGPITFEMVNRDRWGHNIRIQTGRKCCFDEGHADLGGTETAQPGQTLRATVKLEPGRYFFVCAFTSHWGDGMWGRLRVR